jgi:hypothetical protein
MTRHAKTANLIASASEILEENAPQTVRQVFYQLVSRQDLENSLASYKATCRALVAARKEGLIAWEAIEDRLRRPREVAMWTGLGAFVATATASFRRDVWVTQPNYVECWCEKDALSGIFEDALSRYGVTLNVGRGYDGWTSIKDAAARYGELPVSILYYGDFDPSGEDMVRSLHERLAWFGARVNIVKSALTRADIERYRLPPNFTKITDTRRDRFVAKHGDISVELDALPIDVLRERVVADIEAHMDLAALDQVRDIEAAERAELEAAVLGLEGGVR